MSNLQLVILSYHSIFYASYVRKLRYTGFESKYKIISYIQQIEKLFRHIERTPHAQHHNTLIKRMLCQYLEIYYFNIAISHEQEM